MKSGRQEELGPFEREKRKRWGKLSIYPTIQEWHVDGNAKSIFWSPVEKQKRENQNGSYAVPLLLYVLSTQYRRYRQFLQSIAGFPSLYSVPG